MKKFLSIMLVMAMALAAIPSVAAAPVTQEDVIIPNNEIKNAIISMADDDLITLTTITYNASAIMNASSDNAQTYSATINTTALVICDPEDTTNIYEELVSLSNANEEYDYRTTNDTAVGIRLHSTVYFTKQYVDGYYWYRLTRVEGGNNKSNPSSSVIGSGFLIKSQSVTYGVWGRNLEGLNPVTHSWVATKTLDKTAESFNLNVASLHPDWPTIQETQSILGATYEVIIHSTRNNSDRTLTLNNNPLDGVDWP